MIDSPPEYDINLHLINLNILNLYQPLTRLRTIIFGATKCCRTKFTNDSPLVIIKIMNQELALPNHVCRYHATKDRFS